MARTRLEYLLADLIPSSFLLVVTVLYLGAIVILKVFCQNKYRKFLFGFIKATHYLARKAFGGDHGFIRERPEPLPEKGNVFEVPKAYVGQYFVPTLVVVMVGLSAWLIVLTGWMVFWDVFLLKTTYACDAAYDCYFNNGSFLDLPVDDCSDIADDDNVSVTCYTLVFEFSYAFGVVGGFITMAKYTMVGISAFWLFLYTKAFEKSDGYVCCLVFFHVSVVLVWLVLGNVILVLVVDAYGLVGHLTLATYVQAFVFIFTVMIAISIPWCVAKKVEKSEELDASPINANPQYGSIES